MTWGRLPARLGASDTEIPCPGCADGVLWVRISCLGVASGCAACGATYELSDLARALEEDAFEQLEGMLGWRMSDRV